MSELFDPRIGGVLSADIAVPEREHEMHFYSRVLTTGEIPLWREDLMNNQGAPVIGLGAASPEYRDLPLQWIPHIQVADVAASANRVLDLGGSELIHNKDEGGHSQWAVLIDPNGAAFGLIPVVSAEAVSPIEGEVASVGRIAWLDLTVENADTTCDFYREVVGWFVQNVDMKDGDEQYADYNMLGGDGAGVAGVCHARGKNQGLPPVWLIYLPVGDLAESLRRVREEGGTVVKEASTDSQYAYAVIQDPVGVSLGLVPG
ncbi:MAG: hypothetical protein HKN14_00020 [Marinicaulis sp.]|nr:hypothetical protein [Marinicaulis sp.]